MQEENPIQDQYTEHKEDTRVLKPNNKYKILLIVLSVFLLIIVSVSIYRYNRLLPGTHSINSEGSLKIIECVDSDGQCKNKSDGEDCETGVWCDDLGEICGGQSCVGLGLGKCLEGKCISVDDYEHNNNKDEVDRYQYNFCGGLDYCSMNKMCSDVPNDPGVCISDEACVKQWLCGRARELMGLDMDILYEQGNIVPGEAKTRLGYVLVKNTENTDKSVFIRDFECLNYEGLCDKIEVIYPDAFSVGKKDVVIFPIYIKNDNNLNGLASFEFTVQIGGKSSMFSIDVIFNREKICFYQWGNLEESRKTYFQKESTVDWTKYCQ